MAVVGDSITELSREDIAGALASDYGYWIMAEDNRTIAEVQPALDTVLADESGPPDRVVVNLGTNDALQRNPDATAHYDAMLAKLGDADCVVLVTVNQASDVFQERPGVAERLNGHIAELAADDPRVQVLDWERLARLEHPEWLSDRDGIHPNDEGQAALAFFTRLALDDCA